MESAICTSVPDGTQLIETFALTSGGVARLDLHVARMARSAEALGFSFDAGHMRALVAEVDTPAPQRVRLTLAQDGTLDLTTAPLPAAATAPWRVAIHPTRLQSDDPFLRHKTTQRALYNRARAALPDGVDEWLFLNERGEVCEGTITNIAALIDGVWLTPPLSSGCLPGTYRQHVRDDGRVEEAVLTLDDVRGASKVILMNALRGEIAAELTVLG